MIDVVGGAHTPNDIIRSRWIVIGHVILITTAKATIASAFTAAIVI